MKTTLGAILTAVGEPTNDQFEAIQQWIPSAGMTYVSSSQPIPETHGMEWVKSRGRIPTFREALAAHMYRIRGKETIGIFAPSIVIKDDMTALSAHFRNDNPMELSWSFFFKVPGDEWPRAYIITTSVLPHILRDVPADIPFTGFQWQTWMDEWARMRMQAHRYVDASNMGLVYAYEPPAPVQVPEPQPSVESPVTPRKRPKKANG